ncbi:MAG: DUF790 family protein [Candidatus Bathyarchaeia archaeon]
MLPSSLLMTKTRRGVITPVYAELTEENINVAKRLIQAYESHIGVKKGVLKDYVSELEDLGYDYRYVRGLSILLDRRSVFRFRVESNPADIRRRVFELVGEDGVPTNLDARKTILEKTASKLGIRVEEVESLLYADLEDELFLEDFKPLEAGKLVKWYNLALTQTLLFYSTEVKFTALGNWQRIFREVKRLGLIYDVWEEGGKRCWVKVDGPLSLFKLNRRYGTALARLLPIVVKGGDWVLEAKVLRSGFDGHSRLLDFRIEEWKHGKLLEAEDQLESVTAYDSGVERDFALRFEALNTGWKMRREPEPIPAGGAVIIPDFSFEKGGSKVYMEVVGFWTSEYLKRKIEKLGMLKDLEMIVAVDEELACHRVDRLKGAFDVVYFKGKIPLKPVLAHLKGVEERLKSRETREISEKTILENLNKPVVGLDELAERIGVMEEALKEFLRDKRILGYRVLPGLLVREETLREIDLSLKRRLTEGTLSLSEASKIIEKLGGVKPIMLLEALGYGVKWRGIDPSAAEVKAK